MDDDWRAAERFRHRIMEEVAASELPRSVAEYRLNSAGEFDDLTGLAADR